MRKLVVLCISVMALAVTASLAAASGGRSTEGTIVDRLAASPKYSTLVSLVTQAGLADELSGTTELTVFAPTNNAFARLAERNPTLFQAVLDDPNLLVAVLLYHVSAGETTASEIVGLTSVKTLLGQSVAVSVKNGTVRLNGASKVAHPDIQASNGVIHGITEVLIPAT
jgi:uncharacterized surface protein with fasciclin (FAS1) repeats